MTERLEAGDLIPEFAVRDQNDDVVTHDDVRGQGAIIYFYPESFTPGCTTESCDFRDRTEALTEAGYRIFGVSPDPVARQAEFRAEYELPFDLLSDPDHAMAEAFGAWGTKVNYGREYVGLIRSTIVVGPDGRVERALYNVKAKGHAERVAGLLAP